MEWTHFTLQSWAHYHLTSQGRDGILKVFEIYFIFFFEIYSINHHLLPTKHMEKNGM